MPILALRNVTKDYFATEQAGTSAQYLSLEFPGESRRARGAQWMRQVTLFEPGGGHGLPQLRAR